MRSTTFRNIALGILALAAAYHLGARSAGAQAPGDPVAGLAVSIEAGGSVRKDVITANGDVYEWFSYGHGLWYYRGNLFSGTPTPAQRETWGSLKARYRGERAPAQPAPQDR